MAGFSHNLAIVVGIDCYESGISPLQSAVNDVKAIAQRLQQDHHYQVMVLVNQQATLSALQHLIENILPQQVKPDSRLLFYFAGHGIALNGDDGPEGYLIPQDAKAGDTRSYLPMPLLQAALSALSCRHFLGIFDCCFAGAFRWSITRDIVCHSNIIYQERYDRFIQDPAWQILTSAAHDQTALDAFSLTSERPQTGEHSPFAAAFIEALDGKADAYPPAQKNRPAGDGVITATELYLYLRDRVEIATENQTIRQTPGIFPLKQHDKGEYVFLVPGHDLNLPPAPVLDELTNPYRGLQPFEAEHSQLFFGRDLLIDQLQDFVASRSLTVVLGASGAGKSSLVKAGLIPHLQNSKTNEWQILPTVRPGEHPFESLNHALGQFQLPTVDFLGGEKTLAQSVASWRERSPDCRLLIFIDQSEEVITLCSDETERYCFFQQILTAVDMHRANLRVVLSLRSDFEPQLRDAGLKFAPKPLCDRGETELRSRWQKGRFIVPAMTRTQLREAIEKPAEAKVIHFEPYALVDQLIDEVADMPGALPLLSFALSELYLKYLARQQAALCSDTVIDRALTQSDYEEMGGVVYSLTQRANCEYERLVRHDLNYAQTIKNVMLRMVAAGTEIARRKVPASELVYPKLEESRVKQVVERFLSARLITASTDISDEVYIEPAHDALVRGWEKLLIWKRAEEERLPLRRRLTQATNEWSQAKEKNQTEIKQIPSRKRRLRKQSTRFLWHTSPYLDLLEALLQSFDHGFNRLETEFIQRSLRLKQQQKRQRQGITISITTVIAAVAVLAFIQALIAQFNLTTALRRSSSANFANNRYQLDALVDSLVAADRLLSLPGNRLSPEMHTDTTTALATATFWNKEHNRLSQHRGIVQAVDYSSDGRLFATGGYDSEIVVSYADGQLSRRLAGHTGAVMSVRFSPDGQTLASASRDGTVRFWNLSTGSFQVIEAADDTKGTVFTVQFSADGQRLITGAADGIVRIWSREGQLLQTLQGGHSSRIRSAEFSPDGSWAITASDDGTIKFWNLDSLPLVPTHAALPDISSAAAPSAVVMTDLGPDGTILASASMDGTARLWNRKGQLLRELVDPLEQDMSIRSVAFAPTGQVLASGNADGKVSLWSQNGEQVDSWAAHIGPLSSLDFSPDGRRLITVGNDGLTKIWQIDQTPLVALQGHTGSVNSAQFSPDGKRIATGGTDDRTVRLWDTVDNSLVNVIQSVGSIRDVSFSPDAKTIAIATNDGLIQLANLEERKPENRKGQKLRQFKKHDDTVRSVSFSPDGETIASASEDGTVKLWRPDGTDITSLDGHKSWVLSVRFSADGKNVITAGADNTIRIFDLDGHLLKQLEGHTDQVRQAAFSPNGQTVVSASGDQSVKFWDRESGTHTSTVGGSDHQAAVLGVGMSPDGQMIASASSDRTLKLWQHDGKLIATLLGHQSDVNAVGFSPDGRRLISADFQGKVLLWQVEDLSLPKLIERGCEQIKGYVTTTQAEDSENLRKICKTRS
ncbi:MAG: caspase family protein [Cyanobacteria bacterium P01_D01_bin.1]